MRLALTPTDQLAVSLPRDLPAARLAPHVEAHTIENVLDLGFAGLHFLQQVLRVESVRPVTVGRYVARRCRVSEQYPQGGVGLAQTAVRRQIGWTRVALEGQRGLESSVNAADLVGPLRRDDKVLAFVFANGKRPPLLNSFAIRP